MVEDFLCVIGWVLVFVGCWLTLLLCVLIRLVAVVVLMLVTGDCCVV